MSTQKEVIPAANLDSFVAALLSGSSATKSVVSAIVAENVTGSSVPPGYGNLYVVTPNGDGSWTGRMPTRRAGVVYWWLVSASTSNPTGADGFVSGDWAAPKPGTYTGGGAGVAYGS